MSKTIIIFLISIVVIVITIITEKWLLAKYWSRVDFQSAKKWKVQFPNSTKKEIRKFLECFVSGFAFSSKKKLKFEPYDKIIDIYNTLYPPKLAGIQGDAMEYETFVEILEKEYKIDPSEFWEDDITLGNVFENVTKDKKNV